MSDTNKGFQIDDEHMQERFDRIEELLNLYEYNWGQKLKYYSFPAGMTQETMILTLERIVETGESLLVGFNKIKEQKENKKFQELGIDPYEYDSKYTEEETDIICEAMRLIILDKPVPVELQQRVKEITKKQ